MLSQREDRGLASLRRAVRLFYFSSLQLGKLHVLTASDESYLAIKAEKTIEVLEFRHWKSTIANMDLNPPAKLRY